MSDAVEILDNTEIDAIGEILNISMGSAATAISTMLDKQVVITTPKVRQQQFGEINYAELEPAMLVKIEYVEGITGSNVMVFRQRDMQIILNLLMGNEEPPTDDFVFDELSMSAACEVMNQMMGASATALSEFLGKSINISTPNAFIMDGEHTFEETLGANKEENIVSVAFDLNIEGVMNSEFISVLSLDFAKLIVNQVMGTPDVPVKPVQTEAPPPAPSAPAAQSAPAPARPAASSPPPPPPPQAPVQNMPPPQAAYPAQPYPPQGYAAPPVYPAGYPPMYPGYENTGVPETVLRQEVNVQTPQFPRFAPPVSGVLAAPVNGTNLDLIMNVPLAVSIEIGKTKKKIREIMDFAQGTVIELEKQAGAPVDIVVNGQLIARGDVVVIDDNFGVRVTEIIGTKELVSTLENNA